MNPKGWTANVTKRFRFVSGYKRNKKRRQGKQKWKSKRAKGIGTEGHFGGQGV